MADEIAKYTGKNNVQDFDGYFDKIKRYPTPAGALQGYFPVTDGNGQMILRSFTEPGSEGEANANIAPLEDGPTASQAYAVGGLMVYQGQLMTVVQAIVEGGAITPGTNVMSYTVAQALQQKANQAAVNAALAGKLNVIGKGINLLRNSCFVGGGSQLGGPTLPINMRGATEYSTAGEMTINGWVLGAGSVALTAGYLVLTGTTDTPAQFFQVLPDTIKTAINGETVTGTLIFNDGSFISGTISYSSAPSANIIIADSGPVQIVIDRSANFHVVSTTTVGIAELYLEIGTQQTAAYNAGTSDVPDFRLTTIPDYQQALNDCQQYYLPLTPGDIVYGVQVGSTYRCIVPTPVTMIGMPKLTGTLSLIALNGAGAPISINPADAAIAVKPCCVQIPITTSALASLDGYFAEVQASTAISTEPAGT